MKLSRIKKPVWIFLLAAFVFFVGVAVYIAIYGLSDNVNEADAIVVFGNKVDSNGEPSPRLRARLDKAILLFQQGYAPVIIVSGGIDARGFDEAAVMKTYLSRNGIPENSIHSDNQGSDTYRTAQNTASLMRQNGWTRIIVVSQYYHLARCKLAFDRFGIPTVYSAHADFFEPRDLYSLGREVIAFLVYQVRQYK